RMRGFQIWLNLPASEKMKPAAYRDIKAQDIPEVSLNQNSSVKVIAGKLDGATGPIHGLSTEPLIFDVHLAPGAVLEAPVPAGHNAFLYAYEGEARVGAEKKNLPHRAAGLLSDGEGVRLEAGEHGARVLLLAGKPIGEPIVQYGPFVMNSRQEIEQAIQDYQSGELTRDPVRRVA
ncbi:MAG TPA: pirin-like C-terminal cupin domain-containing protein, partial [Burkholderiales bacterium]|nr:pirin-like C-terminal cupin domain-containing protein [Burkholderiales bacterium]